MLKSVRSVPVVSALLALFWLGSLEVRDTYSDVSSATSKWEYTVFTPKSTQTPILEELNRLGKDGWELVLVVDSFQYYLKRPLK